jgi:RIO kinase 3
VVAAAAADAAAAHAATGAGSDATEDHTAATGTVSGELNDYEMAILMQAQFDEEHEAEVTEMEAKANRHGSHNVRISFDKFRSPYSHHERPKPTPVVSAAMTEAASDDHDDQEPERVALFFDPTVKAMRMPDGQLFTKHNAQLEALKNTARLEAKFPMSCATGDVHRKDFKVRIPTKVYNRLKAKASVSEKLRYRVREAKDTSTSTLALDTKTRLILFKMVNSGLLDEIHGVISTGKEAVIFHAVRKVDPEDPHSPQEDCAIKVFKTSLTEFKQRQQFLHGDRRYEHRVGKQSARKLVKVWAEKEMANLSRMQKSGLSCPSVIAYHKHVLVMSFVGEDGVAARKLKETPMSVKLATECLKQVREAMHAMYQKCRLVHADLSEYNLLFTRGKVWIIDVGQSVEPTHPRAHEYLYRDCLQVHRFFEGVGAKDVPTAAALFAEVCKHEISPEQELEFTQTMNASKGTILVAPSDMRLWCALQFAQTLALGVEWATCTCVLRPSRLSLPLSLSVFVSVCLCLCLYLSLSTKHCSSLCTGTAGAIKKASEPDVQDSSNVCISQMFTPIRRDNVFEALNIDKAAADAAEAAAAGGDAGEEDEEDEEDDVEEGEERMEKEAVHGEGGGAAGGCAAAAVGGSSGSGGSGHSSDADLVIVDEPPALKTGASRDPEDDEWVVIKGAGAGGGDDIPADSLTDVAGSTVGSNIEQDGAAVTVNCDNAVVLVVPASPPATTVGAAVAGNGKNKSKKPPKTCHRCGEVGHKVDACPTI